MSGALVSVVTINWNNRDFIELCLEHLAAQTWPALEIIVVDNGSTDGSREILEQRWGARVRLLCLPQNSGFTGGMNAGHAVARGDYVLYLNSDAFLAPTYIAEAVAAFERPGNERVGAVGGKLFHFVDGHKTSTINAVGLFLKWRMAVCRSANTELEERVFGPSGALPMLRRTLLDDVQYGRDELFDRTYFAYNEDIDLWFRIQLLGWDVLYVPTAVGWHVHSGSVGGKKRLYERSEALQVHALKNRYMTILKNYPPGLLLGTAPFLLAVELAVLVFFALRGGARHLLTAQAYVLRHLPAILERRRAIQRRRRRGSRHLLRFFKKL